MIISVSSRTVLLKLASLAVLLFSIYSEIHCTPKDNCNVGTKNCAQMRVYSYLTYVYVFGFTFNAFNC